MASVRCVYPSVYWEWLKACISMEDLHLLYTFLERVSSRRRNSVELLVAGFEGYTVFRSERCKNVVPPRTGVARKAVWGVVKQYRLLLALRVVTSTI